jgi:poly(3-hydroxybutyrate) depolymerase
MHASVKHPTGKIFHCRSDASVSVILHCHVGDPATKYVWQDVGAKNDPVCRSDSFSYKGKWYNSPETGIKVWAGKIGCAQQPDTVIKGACAIMKRWSNRSGAEAILRITAKGGHAWPGGRGILHIPHFEPSNCINANELMCKFFSRHSTQ